MSKIKIKIELERQPGGRGGYHCAPCSKILKNGNTNYFFEIDFQSEENFKAFNEIWDIRYESHIPGRFQCGFRLCTRHKKKLTELIKEISDIKFTTNKFNKGNTTTRWFEIDTDEFITILFLL